MGIPLSFFLIIYAVMAGLGIIYALFNLYHIFRFGHFDKYSYFATGLFIAGFCLIVVVSATFFFQINWGNSLTLFGSSGFNGTSSFQNDFSL